MALKQPGKDYTPFYPELKYEGPHDLKHIGARAARRRDIVQIDAAWHEAARTHDACFAPNGASRLQVAALESTQNDLLKREIEWLRLSEMPRMEYMWKKDSGFCFEECDESDVVAVMVIEVRLFCDRRTLVWS